MSGNPKEAAEEVASSIERLFHWAAFADKFGGTVQETTLYGLTVAVNEPLGVIGITAPQRCPLLGLVSLMAPAIVRGNAVVVVPSQQGALAATDLYQVLDTSDLPGGVINIVTGAPDVLSKSLAEHQDVDAMWFHLEDGACVFVLFVLAISSSLPCHATPTPAHVATLTLSRACSTEQTHRRASKASASRGGKDRTMLSAFQQTT